MNQEQWQRVAQAADRIQAALDRSVEHFDRAGKWLGSVPTILEAWMREGGLTIKDPRNGEAIHTRIHQ